MNSSIVGADLTREWLENEGFGGHTSIYNAVDVR
jgi:hypothetical protein